MNALYLISIIFGVATQNVLKKAFAQKFGGKGIAFFNALSYTAAIVFFVLTSSGLEWNPSILPYSLGFAIGFGTTTICSTMAVACGSLSLTSLITSYSLMVPTVYGLLFLKDPISIGLFPGLVLLVVSLVLINKKSEGTQISVKWLIYVTLAFLGNGMGSVIQKMQQIKFGGAFKSEFMITALLMVAIASSISAVKSDAKNLIRYASKSWHFALVYGMANGMVNLFVMILSSRMPVSLMFPLISSGGIIVTYIISKFYYKETLTKTQLAGFILGIGSVILLNI